MSPRLLSLLLGRLAVLILIASLSCAALANNFIDRRVSLDTNGIWHQYNRVDKTLLFASFGGTLWLGSKDRLGHTFWQSSEACFLAQGSVEIIKRATGRLRPYQTDDPNRWFEGGRSFPSGHVTGTAALVTPFILE
jgi:undecaprenyl-diphosphatase